MSGYDQSITDVIRNTVQDAQDLIRGEIALAKAEMRQEIRRFSAGAAALAVAGVAALIAVIFLLTALAWSIPLMTGWPVWTGFGIVGALLLLVAAGAGLMGRSRLKAARPMPLTMETMKENMQWTRAQKS